MPLGPEYIPVARPDLTGNELAYVTDAIESTWISSSGKYLERFETEFAVATGTRTALGVCNGTIALHLAMLTLDLRPGDEVLVPSLTYVATANAVRYMGAEPVFVDVSPETWCLDPEDVERKITRRTRGIVAVHLYGHPADMDALNDIAAIHGLWVVEDAAEAPLAQYKGRPVGQLGQISTFSFYGNKVLTSGEGGAVCVSDDNLAMRMRTLRGQGVDPNRRYFFPVVGHNFRMTNIAAALLVAQLERADELVARRRAIFCLYEELLGDVPGLSLQPVAPWATTSPWLFCVRVHPEVRGMTRDILASRLESESIDTRPFFIPLHTLPPYRKESAARGESLPVTDALAATGLNLPTFTGMTDDQVKQVADSVHRALRR